MKKAITLLLLLVLFCSGIQTTFSKAVSTFENLVLIQDEFLTRIQEGGVGENQVQAFLDDMDTYISQFREDIYLSDLDAYFVTVLFQTMQIEEHIPILIAFDIMYQDEINDMIETKKVPKSLVNFMMIAFSDLLIIEEPKIPKDPEEWTEPEKPKPEEPKKPLPFSDIEEVPWCVESVTALYEMGVINGTGAGFFSPNRPITREEFLKLCVLSFLDLNDMYLREFGQGGEGQWYHPYLASADFYSLIQGIYDGKEFEKEVPITRQDMATIAYRGAIRGKIKLPDRIPSTDFMDISQFTYYSVQPIQELQEAGVLTGTGENYFQPHASTTRAEAAKIIYLLHQLKENS